MKSVLFFIFLGLGLGISVGYADDPKSEAKPVLPETGKKAPKSSCLASEEIIADLQAREQLINERESALKEKEQEVSKQEEAVKEALARIDQEKNALIGIKEKSRADREEKINKLMETLETMSPKSAAGVLGNTDEELAVLALTRLPAVKSGKILGLLDPKKSSQLSELMAYGNRRREGKSDESVSERAPASQSK